MALISKKKIPYKVGPLLLKYLRKYQRAINTPIEYTDLFRYDNSIPLYDKNGKDTLWETVFYPQSDMASIYHSLKKIYAVIKSDGDLAVIDHLVIDRVDICQYGNTKPFRVRVVNQINDNFDYFYIKNADASRVYGLELEHLLSPNRISYGVYNQTLIEEHIAGIPCDQFITNNLKDKGINEIRLAKEFVKFNERCFVQLLGDMHSSNFVVNITPDFEEVSYRLRAIDFDQQCYEGRRSIYLPQYFKQNNPLIEMGLKYMTPETVRQYQKEERALITNRLKVERYRIADLLRVMVKDQISSPENVMMLKNDLAEFYDEKKFIECKNMGEIVKVSLWMLIKKPDLYNL
ncbi:MULTISPECIES: hypothetical protein [Reichenbachiella]|uniref:Uncharacterized protein n=1 Tax=Reichenbachiella agariperforans TaxID=156994 RepID=A0A1M6RL04_REIAG|nr:MULTISPECIES: hypothetical protein [Reichenbachiella]MBU2915080.1 hypothetical protein [Reichenbachiella agariperforans]RJE70506.1 hypothetical protein BGP76_10485 [Reichenbachiella sp. MSK19-1]SHK33109.1 hypothetical protein SAMN04488028_104217 [Reichenbachiella agariperforans]